MKSKRVNLYFKTISDPSLGRGKEYDIIRLNGIIAFKTMEGWSKPFRAIVDTGAPISLIPLSIWKQLLCKSIKKSMIQGIVARKGCSLPVVIGKVRGQLIDEDGGQSKEIEMLSYLALSDETPLIIGFKDLLEQFKVFFNFNKKIAFLEK